MNILGAATVLSTVMLSLSVAATFLRLLRGPTMADRVVALDLITIEAVGIMLVYCVHTGEYVYLDVAIVWALISFLGTVAFARYLEYRRRSDGKERKP